MIKVPVFLFTEGDFDQVLLFDDLAYANGFTAGFSTGANMYGAGDASAYVIPHDEEDMEDTEEADQIARGYKRLTEMKLEP